MVASVDVAYSDMTGKMRFGGGSRRREKKMRRQASDGGVKDVDAEDEEQKRAAGPTTRRVNMARAMVGDADPKRFEAKSRDDDGEEEEEEAENIMDIYGPDQVNGFTAAVSSKRDGKPRKDKKRQQQYQGQALADPTMRQVSGFDSFSSAPAAFEGDGGGPEPPKHVPPFVPFTTATVEDDEDDSEDDGDGDDDERDVRTEKRSSASRKSKASRQQRPVDPGYLLPSNARQHLGKEDRRSSSSARSGKAASASAPAPHHDYLSAASEDEEEDEDEGGMSRRDDGNTLFYELALYVATGVILIFLTEQFIRIGVKMGEASARSAAAIAASSMYGR